MRDFTITLFTELLLAFKEAGYQFITYRCYMKGAIPAAPFVILRHDIDDKPERALIMAELENELNICGTYYIRNTPKTFDKRLIKRIASLNHEIGYHYEDLVRCVGNQEKAIRSFAAFLKELRTICPVHTICMHGSPLSKHDNRQLWQHYRYRDYGILAELYLDTDFNKLLYLTDTGRFLELTLQYPRPRNIVHQAQYPQHDRTDRARATGPIIPANDDNHPSPAMDQRLESLAAGAGLSKHKKYRQGHLAVRTIMITYEKDIVVSETPHRGQWEKFVLEHPRGNIFQSPVMVDLFRTVPNYNPGVISVKERGVLKGVLCYNIISEPAFRQRLTMRSIICGGPLVTNNNPHYAALLLQRYAQITAATPVIYTQVRNLFSLSSLQHVFQEAGYIYEDHLNILVDLTVSPEEILGQMHRKRAANIRRALKKQIDIRPVVGDEEMQTACNLVTKTYNRINVPCPPRELFLNASYMLQQDVLFLGAFHGNTMIGCRAYLTYKDVLYDWYAASDFDFSHLHPNDLLPWKAMLWGREHNMSTYDFAGAGKPGKPYGVRDYKMRFGGTLYNFGRYTLVHRPWLFRLGKLGMSIYKYIHP